MDKHFCKPDFRVYVAIDNIRSPVPLYAVYALNELNMQNISPYKKKEITIKYSVIDEVQYHQITIYV